MENSKKLFKNKKLKNEINYKNNLKKEEINLISQEKKVVNKVPQIINNYDVKVNITKEKSNNININSMNINSLYSQYNNLNNTYKMPNKSNIFRNIKLNNYLNKTENFSHKKNSPKKHLNNIPLKMKFLNRNIKSSYYDELISNLKSEFQTIEKSCGREFLSKTQNLQKNKFINNRYINVHVLKTNNSNNITNKKNIEDLFLSEDKALLNKEKNLNKKTKEKISSKHNKNHKNKLKYSSDLISQKTIKKDDDKTYNFKIVNFNDIYDNLIGKGNIEKPYYKSENSNKNKSNIFKNIIVNKSKNEKKHLNYHKFNLLNNLNKITFDSKKHIKGKKYKICKNISFSYNIFKYDKYNNYFKYDKSIIDDYNFNIIKSINILKEIINIQSNIIIQFKKKEEELKNEIILKKNEINKYKNACLKFIYYINIENNLFLNNYKKFILIQSQLIKENEILKEIILSNKLFLYKMENDRDNKESIFYLLFKRQKNYDNYNNKNDLLIKNKRNNTKKKKDLINQMLNKDRAYDNPFNIIKNNSYDYLKNNKHKLEKKIENSIDINDKNKYKKKKLCYLVKNRK